MKMRAEDILFRTSPFNFGNFQKEIMALWSCLGRDLKNQRQWSNGWKFWNTFFHHIFKKLYHVYQFLLNTIDVHLKLHKLIIKY